VKLQQFAMRCVFLPGIAILLAACGSGTQIMKIQALAPTADAPYKKVLVVSLFEAFDTRVYLEKEIVKQLSNHGVEAFASTSMMNSKVPATRQTFESMVKEVGADSVLVSHLVSLESSAKVKDMRPESTYNIRPTYYVNVWSVELTEYVEPPSVALGAEVLLATQMYSVKAQDAVWSIESQFKIQQNIDELWDYKMFPEQAKSLVSQLVKDGLIAR
jgi:hypothetical protein